MKGGNTSQLVTQKWPIIIMKYLKLLKIRQ